MRLAYQGEPGAYSEAAALQYGGPQAETMPCKSFEDVFDAVSRQKATHGVVPLENSIGGTIHRNYDLLLDHDLTISGEVELDVVHCLQALPGTKIGDITVVYSHPQALAQCEEFLASHHIDPVPVHDTAGGARMVAESGNVEDAAIASVEAGTNLGLAVLAEHIQTYPDNFTKFGVIGTDDAGLGPPGVDRERRRAAEHEPRHRQPAGLELAPEFDDRGQ